MAQELTQENLPPFDLDYYMSDSYKQKENESMYIEASAGTGKTFTITGIVKTLVEKRGIKLDEILVVTYTEKAVGELRDRIRKSLSKIPGCKADVDNAPIFTIHSFCQNTLSDFSFTANQPVSLELADDSLLDAFIDRWIRDTLTKNENADFKDLFEFAEKQDSLINALKKDLKSALSKYYLNSAGEEEPGIVTSGEKYKVYKTEITDTYENLEEILSYANSPDAEQARKYNSVFSRPGTATNYDKVIRFKTCLFYKKHLKELYLAWQQEKAALKLQSYDDMLRSVREAVWASDSPLLKQLRKKYKYAIIDEFQDTNQKQWDTFSKIFLEDKDHTIIVVGDPKQSIYSFQGADVNVYKNAINQIKEKGGCGYSLAINYRSTDEMIEACNKLFAQRDASEMSVSFFDSTTGITFAPSEVPDKPENKKDAAEYCGEKTAPFWIAGDLANRVSEEDFAKIAVQQIVDCCTIEDNGKTRLQIFDEDKAKKLRDEGKPVPKPLLRNVSFHDFAILARSAPEMAEIEYAMQQAGIPFLRYKDKNLFGGMECTHWISLLNALAANDFTGRNRALLSEALFTEFFNVPLKNADDEKYDNPYCEERQKIIIWQQLAQKREWAKLLEKIFSDSDIENRLFRLDNLQSLSKYRQIGNYAVEYLYKNNCSIEELCKHLSRLSAETEETEAEENIVAKGTDFDCVQVMTIHASKGLGFPVVICPGGFKALNENIAITHFYHENNTATLGFGDYAKAKMRTEENYERQRIFYVAYTRASALMILPFYEKWKLKNETTGRPTSTGKLYRFLNDSFINLFNLPDTEKEKTFRPLLEDRQIADILIENTKTFYENLQDDVKEILDANSLKEKRETPEEAESKASEQKKENRKLAKSVPSLSLKKHSYSSLSHNKQIEEFTENGGRTDKDSDTKNSGNVNVAEFDTSENPLSCVYDADVKPLKVPETFPKGKKLGIALHEVFEKADFVRTGKFADSNEAKTDEELRRLIKDCFSKQTFNIDDKDSKSWGSYMASLVWNVLNAKFPEVTGSSSTGKEFSLNEIDFDSRIAEAEFNLNPGNPADTLTGRLLQNYCNGFIDLVFKRDLDTPNGKTEVYSILDWKSDSFEPDDYHDAEKLEAHTNESYAIQRVLYSYCLVKWLSTFYEGKTLEEIFEKHFGGIYYVYVRGCKAGTGNGIYARSWKSWKELEAAFIKIRDTLIAHKE